MAAPLIVRLVMDAAGYLKSVDTAVASNTRLERSSLGVGEAMQVSANKSVNASLRATEALKTQVAGYRALAASAEESAAVRERAALLANRAENRLNAGLGLSGGAAARAKAVQAEESSLGKFTRGALAGSGAASSLGRSLAFASGGFLAFAVGSELIAKSITSAESLEKAQRSLDVAIQHTGGNLGKLQPEYLATAQAAAKFGVDQATATQGLARATVLTGSAVKAQRAYQEALVISKATGKDFNSVLIATSKGQEGITTSLRRYGVLVDSTSSGQDQFNKVLARFGGQAAANTTAAEKLHASFTNALATIGTALLPTFNKLANSAANYLTKIEKSGQLERDVASGMTAIHDVANPLIGTIKDLSKAFGGLNQGWKDFNDFGNKAGFGHLGIPSPTNLLKSGLENITPLHAVIQFVDSFKSQKSPPVQLIKPSQFFPALPGVTSPERGPFGAAQPIPIFKSFTNTITNQIAQARAALTKSTKDDVAAAKDEIARIKRGIAAGHYAGASLVQALQAEAGAQGVLDGARQQAAQQAAAIAAAKKAAASSYTTPIDLQLAEARSQLTASSADDIQFEKQILAAARAAIASGKKNKQGQLAALQVELQAKQALESLQQQSATSYTLPAKLQLALAKAQATGGNQTKILLEEKAPLEKALKSSKGNIEKQTDIYNQITAINQQLGADANTAFGNYRQASLAAETAGLGLTKAQRKALEARLSQRGPGGTAPGSGTGAGGYIIGPDGRPIQVHRHRRPGHGRDAGGADGGSRKLQATFNIRVYLEGRDVTRSVTIRQQKNRDRNPGQRRGPHAGKQA